MAWLFLPTLLLPTIVFRNLLIDEMVAKSYGLFIGTRTSGRADNLSGAFAVE